MEPELIHSYSVESIQMGDGGVSRAVSSKPDKRKVKEEAFSSDWISLKRDIDIVYDSLSEIKGVVEIKLSDKVKVKRVVQKTIDNDGKKWCKVKGFYFVNTVKTQFEGWIKEDDLTTINPYDWTSFNWQVKEGIGNQFFYQFNAHEGENVPNFVNFLINKIDTDGNRVISQDELQNSMKKEDEVNILSKLICKHSSEWNIWSDINSYISEVEDIYNKGINKEKDDNKKQRFEEIRDERIILIKEKVEKLCFWNEVIDGDIGTPK